MNGRKRLSLRLIGAAVALLSLVAGLLALSQASAATGILRIGSPTADEGEQSSVFLQARDITDPGLGSWTIDIEFDPSLVQPVLCETELGGICNPEYAPDTVRVTGASPDGFFDNFDLAKVTFVCVDRGTGLLRLNVREFYDATNFEPVPIDVTLQNGRVTCAPPTPTPTPRRLLGDVNCDGQVDSRDAQLVLQLEARRRTSLPCIENGDVNLDGRINSVDAALILQFHAGLIRDLPPR